MLKFPTMDLLKKSAEIKGNAIEFECANRMLFGAFAILLSQKLIWKMANL